jgi:hypothetical protein
VDELSKALGRLHHPFGDLHGVPLWVFLLVLLLTSIFLLGYALKGIQVWWQLSSVIRAVRATRNSQTPPDPAKVGSPLSIFGTNIRRRFTVCIERERVTMR